jgi:hypothetical protein
MSACSDFGWRDRAIALAAVGAVVTSRSAFAAAGRDGLQPLTMQVLVSLAVGDPLAGTADEYVGTQWVSRALGVDQEVVEEVVRRLVDAHLVTYRGDPVNDTEKDVAGEDDDDARDESPVVVTELGVATVDRWLARVKGQFRSWPPDRPDVDDVVG